MYESRMWIANDLLIVSRMLGLELSFSEEVLIKAGEDVLLAQRLGMVQHFQHLTTYFRRETGRLGKAFKTRTIRAQMP